MIGQVIRDRFYKYLIPMCMTAFALSLSEFMDGIVVSNLLNSDALAVLNMGTAFNSITSAIYTLFGIGGSICYARYQGQADRKKAEQFFSSAVTFAFIISLIVSIFCICFPETLLNILCKSDNLKPMFNDYIKVQIIAAPLICAVMTVVSFLPAAGYPIESTVFNIGHNVCNIFLDFVFIRVFHLGVMGAALATVTSVIIWSIVVFVWIRLKNNQLNYSLKEGFNLKCSGEIISLGFAVALTQIGFSIKIAYSNSILIELFGKQGVVVFSVCMQLISIMSIFLSGMLRTVTPLVSMLNGQKDYSGIRNSIKLGMKLLGIISFAIVGIILIYPDLVLHIYNAYDPATIGMARSGIRIFALSLGIRCLYMLYMSCVNALGRKKYGLFITLFDGFVGLLIFAKPMVAVFGPFGFWWTYPLASVVLSLCIAVINKIIVKKSNFELDPLCLTKKNQSKSLYYAYRKNDKESLSKASRTACEFARENGFSNRASNALGLVMEEYPLYISEHVKHSTIADAVINCIDDGIIVGFRIIGKAYKDNWIENESNTENIKIVENLIENINYSYVMGINYSQILIKEKNNRR